MVMGFYEKMGNIQKVEEIEIRELISEKGILKIIFKYRNEIENSIKRRSLNIEFFNYWNNERSVFYEYDTFYGDPRNWRDNFNRLFIYNSNRNNRTKTYKRSIWEEVGGFNC
jgi:hypothetical protein